MIGREENNQLMADIWLRATLKAHDFVPVDYWHSNHKKMSEVYLPQTENYSFRENGRIAGFISLSADHIEALFVEPDMQGRGVGGALLEYAKNLHQVLTLAVYEENKNAVAFYLRNGFEIVERRNDDNTNCPELFMIWRR